VSESKPPYFMSLKSVSVKSSASEHLTMLKMSSYLKM
jgi:hypothetical protein